MAMAWLPTLRLVAEPRVAMGRAAPSTLTTATSVSGSPPMSLPGRSWPSASTTVILSAPSMTWWLVRTWPSVRSSTPEPLPVPSDPSTSIWTIAGRTRSAISTMSGLLPLPRRLADIGNVVSFSTERWVTVRSLNPPATAMSPVVSSELIRPDRTAMASTRG
jgi:hypothetical protein